VARRQDIQRLVVSTQPVAAPDAEERRRRAIDLLLQAAAKDTSQSEDSPDAEKKSPPCQALEQDAPTGGAEDDSQE